MVDRRDAAVGLVDVVVAGSSSRCSKQAEQVRSSWRESRLGSFDVGVAILC